MVYQVAADFVIRAPVGWDAVAAVAARDSA